MEQRKLVKVEEEHYGFQHYWILTYDNGEWERRYYYSREWDDLTGEDTLHSLDTKRVDKSQEN